MFHVYILSSKPQGTLYVGSTDDLLKRIWQHKNRAVPGFTADHGVDRLIWFEAHETRESAPLRERQIKEWKRAWKIELIEQDNPAWLDLYRSLTG
jgi:putative endonuclease